MKKEDYNKDTNITIVNRFTNEHWEEFILYKIGKENMLFITWDEMDWESGYTVNYEWVVAKYFRLSNDERDKVLKYFL